MPAEPFFVLRGNNETTVNYVKFLGDPVLDKMFLWTACGDGKVRRWCLETMRVTATIDAHTNVNGGAYWVDGVGSNVFTQGRNGVVKRFVILKEASSAAARKADSVDPDDDDDDDDENCNDDDDDDEQVETAIEFCETIRQEEDFGFCVSALTLRPNGGDPRDSDVLLAIPKSRSRVSIYPLRCRRGSVEREERSETRFDPDASLKLGMSMSMTFAEANSSQTRVLVGYEDGSLVLWGAACPFFPRFNSCKEPLRRLKMFDSEPVLALDYSPRFHLGFAGSAGKTVVKFLVSAEEGVAEDHARPSLIKSAPKVGIDFPNDGISCVRLRSLPDLPRLAVAGGWDAQMYVFTPGNLKPLAELDFHRKTIRCVDFNDQSGVMAAASDDSHVSLWDLYCEQCEQRR